MAANLESGKETQLALPLSTTDTEATLFSVPTKTSGRLYITDGTQEERVNFTGVSGSKVTGLTRNLSKTGDPATGGTGLAFIAGSTVRLVAMHDQIVDKTDSNTYKAGTTQTFDALVSKDVSFTGTTTAGLKLKSLTTAQRTALTGANGMMVYDSDIGVVYQYVAGSRAQVAISGLTPMLLTGDQTASGIKTFNDIMKKRSTTNSDTSHYITLGTRYEINGIDHASLGHVIQVLRGDMTGEGTGNDGTWGYMFGNYGRPYLYMRNNDVQIGRSDGTLTIPSTGINFDGGNIRRSASDAEALAGSSTTTTVSPYQGTLLTYRQLVKTTRNTLGVQTISHSLGKVPKLITVQAVGNYNTTYNIDCNSFGKYDGTNQYCTYKAHVGSGGQQGIQDNMIAMLHDDISTGPVNYQMVGTIQNVTSSQFEINWTNTYGGAYIQNVTLLIEIA